MQKSEGVSYGFGCISMHPEKHEDSASGSLIARRLRSATLAYFALNKVAPQSMSGLCPEYVLQGWSARTKFQSGRRLISSFTSGARSSEHCADSSAKARVSANTVGKHRKGIVVAQYGRGSAALYLLSAISRMFSMYCDESCRSVFSACIVCQFE